MHARPVSRRRRGDRAGASGREAREAELFWADLVGARARGGAAPVESAPEVPAGAAASPCDLARRAETLDGFAAGSAALAPAHAAVIRRVAEAVAAIAGSSRPIREIDVAGFGGELGARRAEAVRRALAVELARRSAAAPAIRVAARAGGGGRVEISVPIAVTDVVVHEGDPDTHEIPSRLGAGGREHFVSVRGAGDVVLEAHLAPNIAGDAGARLAWSSPAAPDADARTARIARAAAGKLPIELRLDGAVVREPVVWIVWASVAVTATRDAHGERFDGGLSLGAGIDHRFTLEPAALVTDADRPALDGPRTAPVPGAAQRHVISGNTLAGGAGSPRARSHKWDATRQIRMKVLNPRLYPAAQLVPVAGHLWGGQPVAVAVPEDYPVTAALGNDDSHDGDETNDPYAGACGVCTSRDDPRMSMLDATGADGDTFETRFQFRELLRVNLGDRWYRASDVSLWRFHARFRRAGDAWADDGSTFARDNEGF